jgi:hypothetical protein
MGRMVSASHHKRQPNAYALANAEFRLALSRVGATLRKNGEWLVRFASLKKPLLAEGKHTQERADLWHDLLCLSVLANRARTDEVGRDLNEVESEDWRSATNFYRRPQAPHLYQAWWESVRHVRAEVYRVLDDLLRNEHVSLELTDTVCDIDLQGHRVLRVPLASLILGGRMARASLQTAVLLRLAQILEKHRLHRCAGCAVLFFAHRSDQEYHDRSCQMKFLMQRRRDKGSAPHKKSGKKSPRRKPV